MKLATSTAFAFGVATAVASPTISMARRDSTPLSTLSTPLATAALATTPMARRESTPESTLSTSLATSTAFAFVIATAVASPTISMVRRDSPPLNALSTSPANSTLDTPMPTSGLSTAITNLEAIIFRLTAQT